jgi:transforming growth factor-beta-induced protein
MKSFTKLTSMFALACTMTLGGMSISPSAIAQTMTPTKAELAAKNKVAKQTIVQIAVGAPQLENLVRLLKAADLVNALNGKGPFTVFAPTNLATSYLAKDPHDPKSVREMVEKLEKDPAALAAILKLHVVPGRFPASSLTNGAKLKTLNGETLKVKKSKTGSVQLVTASGSPVATVQTADIKASNGVVHIIDQVLLPKGKMVAVTPAPTPMPNPTPVDVTPKLSTLYGLLGNLGIDKSLNVEGKKFTVLAPDNQAFANLSFDPHNPDRVKADLDVIFKNEPLIKKVLANHVFEGVVRSTDLKDGMVLTNVLGDKVTVSLKDGKVFFVDATSGSIAPVNTADVETPYGIQHVVSEVLLP